MAWVLVPAVDDVACKVAYRAARWDSCCLGELSTHLMRRSLSLKEYGVLKPMGPNLLRSCRTLWKKARPVSKRPKDACCTQPSVNSGDENGSLANVRNRPAKMRAADGKTEVRENWGAQKQQLCITSTSMQAHQQGSSSTSTSSMHSARTHAHHLCLCGWACRAAMCQPARKPRGSSVTSLIEPSKRLVGKLSLGQLVKTRRKLGWRPAGAAAELPVAVAAAGAAAAAVDSVWVAEEERSVSTRASRTGMKDRARWQFCGNCSSSCKGDISIAAWCGGLLPELVLDAMTQPSLVKSNVFNNYMRSPTTCSTAQFPAAALS
jgi:hypothetical protein